MDKNTLQDFLLRNLSGALLISPEITPNIPGSIAESVDHLDMALSEMVRFKLVWKINIGQVCTLLRDYYTSINWVNSIDVWDDNTVAGDVWPQDGIVLALWAGFEPDESGAITDRLNISLHTNIGPPPGYPHEPHPTN